VVLREDTDSVKRSVQNHSVSVPKLSNRNPTWNIVGWEQDPHVERPTTNRLSHGVALNFMELPVAGKLD